MKTITGDGWRLAVPDGLIATDHRAYGYEAGPSPAAGAADPRRSTA